MMNWALFSHLLTRTMPWNVWGAQVAPRSLVHWYCSRSCSEGLLTVTHWSWLQGASARHGAINYHSPSFYRPVTWLLATSCLLWHKDAAHCNETAEIPLYNDFKPSVTCGEIDFQPSALKGKTVTHASWHLL